MLVGVRQAVRNGAGRARVAAAAVGRWAWPPSPPRTPPAPLGGPPEGPARRRRQPDPHRHRPRPGRQRQADLRRRRRRPRGPAAADVSAPGGLQGAGQGLVKAWAIDQTRRRRAPADGPRRRRHDQAPLPAAARRRHRPLPLRGRPRRRRGRAQVQLTDGRARRCAPQLRAADAAARRPLPVSLKKVIVIDAGHGGHDPGRPRRAGLREGRQPRRGARRSRPGWSAPAATRWC